MRVQIPSDKRQIGLWVGSLILLLALIVIAFVFLSTMLKPAAHKTPPVARVVTGRVPAPPPQVASLAPQTAAEAEALPPAGATDLTAATATAATPVTALTDTTLTEISAAGRFAIQVGAFKDAVNARQEMRKMQERGLRAFHYKRTDSGQQVWHVVCIGNYTTLDEASAAAKAYDGRYQTGAFGMSVATLERVGATE